MTWGSIGKIVAGVLATALLAFATPAAAQSHSDGYKFLQAVEKKDRTAFDTLIAKNHTVVNARDLTNGRSGLHIAVDRRDPTWLGYLISEGANPNIADVRGVTPLLLASQTSWLEGMSALIAAGAKVDEPNSTGETPLIAAVHQHDIQMMRLLLRAGADPDRSDNAGRSARDYATEEGRSSAVLAEIERNARPANQRQAPAETYGPS